MAGYYNCLNYFCRGEGMVLSELVAGKKWSFRAKYLKEKLC